MDISLHLVLQTILSPFQSHVVVQHFHILLGGWYFPGESQGPKDSIASSLVLIYKTSSIMCYHCWHKIVARPQLHFKDYIPRDLSPQPAPAALPHLAEFSPDTLLTYSIVPSEARQTEATQRRIWDAFRCMTKQTEYLYFPTPQISEHWSTHF